MLSIPWPAGHWRREKQVCGSSTVECSMARTPDPLRPLTSLVRVSPVLSMVLGTNAWLTGGWLLAQPDPVEERITMRVPRSGGCGGV